MPEYLFQHPDTQEVISIFQNMKEEHIYIDNNGILWNRLFTKPTATISSIAKIDPHNPNSFMDVTAKKAGTLGDMFDLSKELSEKREKSDGKDKIKEQFYKNYSKNHGGKSHPEVKKKQLKEKLAKNNSMFEWKD